MSSAKLPKGIPVSSKKPTSGRDSGTHSRSSSVSNLDLHTGKLDEASPDFKLDERVFVNGSKPGCVRFLGKTQFAPGIWAGVHLDEPVGKNDGSVAGVQYFSCEPLRGIFARPQKLARGPESPQGSTCSIKVATPSLSSRACCSKTKIGERVAVSSATGVKSGILRFLGETDFAKGEWAGIELDEPVGKNDGSVAGKRYFSCAMKYGLFSPLHKVSRAGGTSPAPRGTPIMRSASRDSLSSSISSCSKASGRLKQLGALTAKTRTGMGLMTTSRALEETLKEKEKHIEKLLKEHDLEKVELAKISVRCEEAESRCVELEKQLQQQEGLKKSLEDQWSSDKRRLDDLSFLLEEEKAMKSDVEQTLKDLQARFLENQKQTEGLNAAVQEKEELILNLSTRLAELNERISHDRECGEKNMLLSEELKAKNRNLEELQNALKEKDCEMLSLLHNFETQGNQNIELSNQTCRLQQTIAATEADLASRAALQKSLETELAAVKCQLETEIPKHEEKILCLVKDIERLTGAVEEKEDELARKLTEVSHLTSKVEELTASNAQLQSKLLSAEENLFSENTKSTEKIISIETQLECSREEKENLAATMLKELEEKQSDYEQLSRDFESKKSALAERELEISRLSSLLSEKGSKCSKIENEVRELKNSLDALSKEKTDSSEANAKIICELREQVEELQRKRSEESEALRLKEEEIGRLNAKLQLAEQSVEMLNRDGGERVAALQSELAKTQQEIEKLQDTVREMALAMEEKDRALRERAENVSRLQDELDAKESDLSSQADALRQQVLDLSNREKELLATQEADISALREGFCAELKKKEQELSEKNETVRGFSESVNRLTAELSALRESSDEAKKSLEMQLRASREELSAKLEEKDEMIKETLEERAAELRQKQSDVASLRALLEEKEAQFDDLVKSSREQRMQLEEQNQNNLKLLSCKESLINDFRAEKDESLKLEKRRFEEAVKSHEAALRSKDETIGKLNTETESLRKSVEALVEELKASNETAVQNTNEVHKGFIAQIAVLEENYSKLLEEKKMVEHEENKTKEEKMNLEASLLKEKLWQEEVVKDKEAQLDALRAEVVCMRAEFEQKLDASEKAAALERKKEADLQRSVLEELQQKLQNSEKKNSDLQAKLTELTNLSAERIEVLKKLQEVEKLNEEKTERMRDLKEKLKDTKQLLESNKNSLKEKEEECLALCSKVKSLECDVEEKIKPLEQENILLKHKIEEKSPPDAELSSKGDPSQLDSEERESLISQIDFLNSIIVDMKHKNQTLMQEAELLKMGPLDFDSNFNDVKQQVAPRMFCDICDVFDLHDTDECPKQASFVEEEAIPHLLPQGTRKLEERPYCNNCEVFGHWTLDCDDQETY